MFSGGTQATEGKYSFDLLTADVIALMDALAIKRAHFAGLSMGGVTALFLAQRHADRFERIIACDCVAASTPASAQQWSERIALAQSKGMDTLAEARLAGPSSLTIAELRILRFLPSHRSFREIGAQLNISTNTVKTQAQAIYRKLWAASRSEAVARATGAGLLGP